MVSIGVKVLRVLCIAIVVIAHLSEVVVAQGPKLFQSGKEERHGSCAEDSTYRTALKITSPLPFCDTYDTATCCSNENAEEIRETVHDLVRPKCSACFHMIKSWKCSQCHPNSGSFYKGARSSILFCEDYCEAVFEACRDIPLDLERGYFYLNEADMIADEWCQGRTGDEGHCFRGPLPTPEQIAQNEECQCEDHDCHDEATEEFQRAQEEAERTGIPMYDWQKSEDNDEL